MNIREDWYAAYADKFGLVSNNTNGDSTGNGLLYTAEYIIGLYKTGITDGDRAALSAVYNSCQKDPGLMNRTPDEQFGINSIDDYTGCAAASMILDGGDLARRIIEYGRTNKAFGVLPYHYNNVEMSKFNVRALLLRFPAMLCAIKWSGGIEPNWLEKIAYCVSMVLPKSSQDDFSLSYIMAFVGRRRYAPTLGVKARQSLLERLWDSIVDGAIARFTIGAKKAYVSPGEVRAQNFNDVEHPAKTYLGSWDY